MIEYHAVAFEEKRACQQNCSSISSGNRRPLWDCIVEPLMHALRFAVKGAAGAEDIGDGRTYGWPKSAGPFSLGFDPAEHVLLEYFLLVDAFELLRAGLGKLLGNGHRDAGIFCGADSDLSLEGDSAPGSIRSLQLQQ